MKLIIEKKDYDSGSQEAKTSLINHGIIIIDYKYYRL